MSVCVDAYRFLIRFSGFPAHFTPSDGSNPQLIYYRLGSVCEKVFRVCVCVQGGFGICLAKGIYIFEDKY